MEKPNEYEIETVEDFLMVPEDRIDDCLKDFKSMLEDLRDAVEVCPDGSIFQSFTWIDDGKNEKVLQIGIKKG